MKKTSVILLAVVMLCFAVGFGAAAAPKACFITNSPLGNEFIDLAWRGFKDLEAEGWQVRVIEATDASEYAEDIRDVAEQGYTVIMTWNDDVSTVAIDLADEIKDMYIKNIPLARFGEAKEVANAVAFLLSDEASYITGEVLKVNGGLYM